MFQRSNKRPPPSDNNDGGDDGWNPEDDRKYLGLDYDDEPAPTRQRTGGLIEEGDDVATAAVLKDDDDGARFDAYDFVMPVSRSMPGGSMVPYKYQEAAVTLEEYSRLPGQARPHVALLAQGRPHEFIKRDPDVVLRASFNTGTSIMALREVCSVSKWLLLCAFNARYTVQVTPKAKSEPQEFIKVRAKPYYGEEFEDDAQPFNVDRYIDDICATQLGDGVDVQLNAYIWSLGMIDAAVFFQEDSPFAQTFKEVALGEKKVVRKRVALKNRKIDDNE
jgi:hypothetical protein